MTVIGSLLFWGYGLLVAIVCFPVALVIRGVTSPFDRRLVLLHMFSSFWASLYLWGNPLWSVRIDGKEHIARDATYVMVSNHQSLLDIMVLYRMFVHFKWVSKAENFRIPFIGWNMTLNRYIRIDRGRVSGNLGMMRGCVSALREGSSVMIFPEGTRSPDGNLREFKPGAFEIAFRVNAPLLPIVIEGTATALPKKGLLLRGKQAIRVRVLEPVAPPWPPGTDATALLARTHERIRSELAAMRRAGAV